jgi:5-methyltetrahydropteroyltriglutamate--homocysteine methyltransferase
LKLSTDRILTTHVGSLPRPAELYDLLVAEDRGETGDKAALEAKTAAAVKDAVARQVECGIDVVSDGEMSKIAYTFYVKHRLSGIQDGEPTGAKLPDELINADLADHPDFAERVSAARGRWALQFTRPWVTGPLSYENHAPLERDIAHLNDAFAPLKPATKPTEAFMNAASPGVLSKFVPDAYYRDEDNYIAAMADAMKIEYEAIHAAGFLLQIDCPDLASARHNQYSGLTDDEFLKIAERNVEAVNAATANIPADAMRIHICWGNYEGPHTHDIPLAKVFPLLMKARPAAVLFEGANPRHEHEWEDIEDAKIPDHKVLVPGVIDSTTNFVEHPKLIAQRICRYAAIVGRERVLASSDCGFGTFARKEPTVAPSVVWSKFRAMAEGARLATEKLWR